MKNRLNSNTPIIGLRPLARIHKLRGARIATLLCLLLTPQPCVAAGAQAGLAAAVDQPVSVEMLSGDSYQDAVLLRIVKDRKTGEPRSLRLRLQNGKTRTLGLRAVRSVALAGKMLLEQEPASSEQKPDRRLTRAERRAAAEAEHEKERAEAHQKWLARLRARGVKPWPTPTEAQHRAATQKYKQRGDQAIAMFPGLRLYETQRFLFYSNIPPQQVGPFIARLDQMHEWMTAAYNLPPKQRVWLGKAPVYAFLNKQQFVAFERKFYQNDPAGAYGLCHQNSNGEVLISCYRGQEPMEFAQMLVHETSHGFIHRYKTIRSLPSWVNEGMADYIAELMTPKSRSVKTRETRAAARLKERPVLRKDFFGKGKINFDEYGIASSLTRFMITTSQENYIQFIEGLKEGMPWEEALREAYRSEPSQLVRAYGQWIGAGPLRVE